MANDFQITAQDIQAMVNHWLSTPVNGYLGSDYGADCNSLLQQPMRSGLPDAFIKKMLRDIPILTMLPKSAIYIFTADVKTDRKRIGISVAGQAFTIPGQ